MKLKTNSLTVKIWLYLALFSTIILIFLWTFLGLSLKGYYELNVRKTIKDIGQYVSSTYDKENRDLYYDRLSYTNNICIEIIENKNLVYTSQSISKGCITNTNANYKTDFMVSNKNNADYSVVNNRLQNKTLIRAVKVNPTTFAFINTSLEPIDRTVTILKQLLIITTLLIFTLSFIVAVFISRKISKPIINIKKQAKNMSDGDYTTPFNSNENIAEINELADTLNETRIELAKTEETRRDLMANVSHDLKTPLTMIKAYAEMARDLNISSTSKRTDNLNIIIEESDRLNLLVNDILELSKAENKIGELDYTEIDLIKLIKTILKRYDVYKIQDKYKFIFNYPKKTKIKINADKKKIEQVIYNLINNAVNYTGKDNLVTVNVEKNEDNVLVSITDTGKGIEQKDIEHIWDKYYKNDKHHKRNVVGTGLGLSIVKTILVLHGYKYGVYSKVNEGTTFYFIIDNKYLM
ncbi:MAG: HAMP domain-containing sensor histidine kinase [Bacilli bacterium]